MTNETLSDVGLLRLAEALHGHVTGATDPLPNPEEYADLIQKRLDKWHPAAFLFDSAVRLLLEVTMHEYREAEKRNRRIWAGEKEP